MARPKVYTIQLTDDECFKLDKTIRNKSTCKTVLKRCQILRELDLKHGNGLTHAQVAHTYAVCPATVTNLIKDYVNKGIDYIIQYNISPNSADGRTEAKLIQLACAPAPDGHSRWTVRRLEERHVSNLKHLSVEKQSEKF